MESRPRAPDSALQVLRLPDGVVAGAGPSATRCPAHPATASAPHRAGGSTYVRSVTLQRRTRHGAVEAPQGFRCSPSREGTAQPGSATKDGGEEQLEGNGASVAIPRKAGRASCVSLRNSLSLGNTRGPVPADMVDDSAGVARAPTSPRNYPASCSQREPKRAKADEVRSANLRGVVCGSLACVSIQKGLITQRSLVQIQPPQPLTTRVSGRKSR